MYITTPRWLCNSGFLGSFRIAQGGYLVLKLNGGIWENHENLRGY